MRLTAKRLKLIERQKAKIADQRAERKRLRAELIVITKEWRALTRKKRKIQWALEALRGDIPMFINGLDELEGRAHSKDAGVGIV